jgi:hypothetical protein
MVSMKRISQYNNPGRAIKGSGWQSGDEMTGISGKCSCNAFKLPLP